MVKYHYRYESTVDFRNDREAMERYLNSRGEMGYRLFEREVVDTETGSYLMFTWEVTENE
jgi:hypothetical protein